MLFQKTSYKKLCLERNFPSDYYVEIRAAIHRQLNLCSTFKISAKLSKLKVQKYLLMTAW